MGRPGCKAIVMKVSGIVMLKGVGGGRGVKNTGHNIPCIMKYAVW